MKTMPDNGQTVLACHLGDHSMSLLRMKISMTRFSVVSYIVCTILHCKVRLCQAVAVK